MIKDSKILKNTRALIRPVKVLIKNKIQVYRSGFVIDWTSSHIPAFMSTLKAFLINPHEKQISVLEIGCFEGRTTLWFLKNLLTHPGSSIHCIDRFKGGYGYQYFNMRQIEKRFKKNTHQFKNKVFLHKGCSHIELVKLKNLRFDIIYLDASHNAHDVLSDAFFAFSLLKEGGYLLFDDYLWKGIYETLPPLLTPKPGIDAFLHIFSDKLEVIWNQYQLHIKKTEP